MNQVEPLPALWDKLLDLQTLDQYFQDLAKHAQIISIQEKHAATEYVQEGTLDLTAAREKVMAGVTRAVQIRYRFDDQEWCDTLLRQPTGVKLVRMEQCSPVGDG